LKSLQRGEVHQYSQVFNETRHRALERIRAEARSAGANAVVGIQYDATESMAGVT